MRIRSGKTIRLVRQDRPRRIDIFIDYFGSGGGMSPLKATAAPAHWEPSWNYRIQESPTTHGA